MSPCERIEQVRQTCASYEKLALDVFCAIAILYIEHRLPHVRNFRRSVTERP